MADSGSPRSIITEKYFHEKFDGTLTHDDLSASDVIAQGFDGSIIDLMGYEGSDVSFKGRTMFIKLYVAKKGANVLGWRDQWKLGIILNPRSKKSVLVVEDVDDGKCG